MFRTRLHAARLLPIALGIVALAFGPWAAASASSPAAPTIVPLSQGRVGRWAYPQATATVRATPSAHARAVGRLRFLTPDGLGQAQIYEALRKERVPSTGVTWIDVSIPGRPNGKTGWVRASALGPLNTTYGLILVNRERFRITLYNKAGKAIFTAPVGVGRPALPTPAGHFYVLEKFSLIDESELGPFALATSAYAPTLSEWPGGGVVGVHGTNEPQLIPGRPSHGCVRMRDSDIERLWPLIGVGTPIDII